MIPCRVFLQQMQVFPSETTSRPRISLTLNNIYYDQIKPFQTKYFCLTAHDVLGVEAMLQESQIIVGKTQISNAYKLVFENKNVEIRIIGVQKSNVKQIRLSFSLQPVSALSRRKMQSQNNSYRQKESNTKGISHLFDDHTFENQNKNRHEISFSHREPRDPLSETNSILNINKEITSNKLKDSIKNIYHDQPLFNDSLRSADEAQSLQSLAQQREKILGELFGRFKRDK